MILDIVREISAAYEAIDRKSVLVKLSSGIRCPVGCGLCCESTAVEATVSEVLPLALELYSRRRAEAVHRAIEEKELRNDPVCLFYRPQGNEKPRQKAGACSIYPFRPLVCRLFGFSARRDRHGHLEFCPCREMKRIDPEGVWLAVKA